MQFGTKRRASFAPSRKSREPRRNKVRGTFAEPRDAIRASYFSGANGCLEPEYPAAIARCPWSHCAPAVYLPISCAHRPAMSRLRLDSRLCVPWPRRLFDLPSLASNWLVGLWHFHNLLGASRDNLCDPAADSRYLAAHRDSAGLERNYHFARGWRGAACLSCCKSRIANSLRLPRKYFPAGPISH